MSEMEDRVAMAIRFVEEGPNDAGTVARMAIEAMREPTPEMIRATRDHIHEIGANTDGEAWRFMIDAALK